MSNKLLNPKNDYVFKRLFGHVGNETITKNLLSCILQLDITDIQLDSNPITEKELFDDKVGILDIKAKIDNTTNIDIEMQVVDKKNIEKRILFYLSKMYTKTISSGDDYDKLEKCVSILFTDYNLDVIKNIPKYITKWNIREEEYRQIVLTDVMEICIIELRKFKDYKEKSNHNSLNSWIEFIESPEVVDMSNKEIQKAKKVLEEISQNEHEQYLAELREKYIKDQKATEAAGYDKGLKTGLEQGIQQGLREGMQQGLKDGLQQGLQQGMQKEKLQIAKKMLSKKIDLNIISQLTGLSIQELKNL